jgi:retinol dehydrogenase 12
MTGGKNKTCLITGATSGIGRETALDLAARGMKLVLPVRNIEKGRSLLREIHDVTGNGHAEIFYCDLESMDSIRGFAAEFLKKYDRLDVLINNAGIWETRRSLSQDGIERVFAVNHLAPFLLTNLLLEALKHAPGGRIINVSSNAHRAGKIKFSDLEGKKKWSHIRAYTQSKLANILFTRKLARMLEGSKATANCLHPGFVQTSLFEGFPDWMMSLLSPAMLSSQEGARTSIFLAASPELDSISGAYFARKKMKTPARAARSDADAERLWDVSLEYTGKPGVQRKAQLHEAETAQ